MGILTTNDTKRKIAPGRRTMLAALRRDEAIRAERFALLPDRANRTRLESIRREIAELESEVTS